MLSKLSFPIPQRYRCTWSFWNPWTNGRRH